MTPANNLPIEKAYGRRTRQSLEDMVRFGALAAALIARGKAAYDGDQMLRLAGEAISTRIGEAAGRLGATFVSDHPGIALREAKDLRNLVSHGYDRVDPAMVWVALARDVPVLTRQVERLLRG